MVHFLKQIGYIATGNDIPETNATALPWDWEHLTLERLGFSELPYFIISAATGSYVLYFGIGGFIHVSL